MSLENPNVRSLLEVCAAAGMGTTGLNTKSLKKAAAEASRKPPNVSAPAKKSTSPAGAKKVVAEAVVGEGGGSNNGKKKTPAAAATPVANGDAGSKQKAKIEAKPSTAKPESSKGGSKSPKSPPPTKSPPPPPKSPADIIRKRTPTKSVGKPGLALPVALLPELARMIEKGGESGVARLDRVHVLFVPLKLFSIPLCFIIV